MPTYTITITDDGRIVTDETDAATAESQQVAPDQLDPRVEQAAEAAYEVGKRHAASGSDTDASTSTSSSTAKAAVAALVGLGVMVAQYVVIGLALLAGLATLVGLSYAAYRLLRAASARLTADETATDQTVDPTDSEAAPERDGSEPVTGHQIDVDDCGNDPSDVEA